MWTILQQDHDIQLEKECKKCCFDYGKLKGDVIISCNDDELIKTQSEMLLLCSEFFSTYKTQFDSNDITLHYDKTIVILVLKTFYGEEIENFETWKDVLNFFELAELLIPCDDVSLCLEQVCDKLVNAINNPRYLSSDYKLVSSFSKLFFLKSEKIIQYLSTTDNKYVKKINDSLQKPLHI